jgi:glutamate dehydrogenase
MLLSAIGPVCWRPLHRHIFIVRTRRAVVSFKERARMFKLPRSSWEDYNKALILGGGGIYPRSAKSIPLSAQASTRLASRQIAASMSSELMSVILKAPVDLRQEWRHRHLVKASSEHHSDVGDRANNALR